MIRIVPERHQVRRIPFTDYLEREYPYLPLFVYFHTITKNWIVALRLGGRDSRFAAELYSLGPSTQEITREMVQELRLRLATWGLTREQVRKIAEPYEHLADDTALETEDRWDFRRRRSRNVSSVVPVMPREFAHVSR